MGNYYYENDIIYQNCNEMKCESNYGFLDWAYTGHKDPNCHSTTYGPGEF